MKKTLAMAGCLLLAACNMQDLSPSYVSEKNYKQCLAANPSMPYNCEGLRRIYEIDQDNYLRNRDDSDRFFKQGAYAPDAKQPVIIAPNAYPYLR